MNPVGLSRVCVYAVSSCVSAPPCCSPCSVRSVVCFLGKPVPALRAGRAGAASLLARGGRGPCVCACARCVRVRCARAAPLRRARSGGGGCAPRQAGARARRGGGRAARRGPAAAGSNGEAGAAPTNYISGTSIIRGKTRKRWRPAPGGPLPERPGPSLLLPPPPRGAPAPPRPRRDPDPGPTGGHSAGQPQAERSRLRRRCAWWPDSKWDRRTRKLAVSSAGTPRHFSPLPAYSPLFGISLNFIRSNASGRGGLKSLGPARLGDGSGCTMSAGWRESRADPLAFGGRE